MVCGRKLVAAATAAYGEDVHRLPLALAIVALVAAGLATPGQLVALGGGIAAIGSGRMVFHRRDLTGGRRLAGALAIALGALAATLGIVRIALTLLAIGRLEHMFGG